MGQSAKVANLLSRVRRFWSSVSSRRPEVFLHDPAAALPRDLDDPFDNADVQTKVGKILAARK
jgi:hypothetical protein